MCGVIVQRVVMFEREDFLVPLCWSCYKVLRKKFYSLLTELFREGFYIVELPRKWRFFRYARICVYARLFDHPTRFLKF